jgi:signal transduction histidine kinase
VKRLPIRARVTLAFAGVMVLLLAGLSLFIYLRFQSNLDDQIDTALEARASEVTALLERSRPPGSSVQDLLVQEEESFGQVLTPAGQIFGASPKFDHRPLLAGTDLANAAARPLLIRRTDVPGVGTARIYAAPVDAGGREFVVAVGTGLDDRHDELASLRTILLVGVPAVLLLAALAGYLTIAGALRPVEAMRRRAAEITAAEPDSRLPLPEADDEIHRLGETLNEMLGRLDTALARERAFVDDASHELRTPLAMHKTELELALRYAEGSEEMRAAIVSAIEEVDRLIGLAEDLLVLARSEQGKLPLDLGQMPAAELLGDVRERFAARAAAAGRPLVAESADGLRLEADRVRIEQALANLVENALEHGAGEIGLRVIPADGAVEIHVEDRGPGFPPEFIDRAFERFSRGDVARTGGGTGLGLAIVEAIARAHRGSAHARNRETGGADVWVRLPS